MKKSLAIIIVFILLALGGGGYWFYSSRKGEEGAPPGAAEEGAPEEESFVGKIVDALKLGKAMKCTWSYEGDSATFYLKGNKYRGDMTPKGEEKVSYIYRDNCTYFWQEGEKQGMKWCWTPAEAEEMMSEFEKGTSGAALGYEYNCQPTVVSDSVFTLPSGVNFMDMSEYMQPTP